MLILSGGCRPEFANQVFKSGKFLHRLGEDGGLMRLGMFHRGIIWNNDTEKWAELRTLFKQGDQSFDFFDLFYYACNLFKFLSILG